MHTYRRCCCGIKLVIVKRKSIKKDQKRLSGWLRLEVNVVQSERRASAETAPLRNFCCSCFLFLHLHALLLRRTKRGSPATRCKSPWRATRKLPRMKNQTNCCRCVHAALLRVRIQNLRIVLGLEQNSHAGPHFWPLYFSVCNSCKTDCDQVKCLPRESLSQRRCVLENHGGELQSTHMLELRQAANNKNSL